MERGAYGRKEKCPICGKYRSERGMIAGICDSCWFENLALPSYAKSQVKFAIQCALFEKDNTQYNDTVVDRAEYAEILECIPMNIIRIGMLIVGGKELAGEEKEEIESWRKSPDAICLEYAFLGKEVDREFKKLWNEKPLARKYARYASKYIPIQKGNGEHIPCLQIGDILHNPPMWEEKIVKELPDSFMWFQSRRYATEPSWTILVKEKSKMIIKVYATIGYPYLVECQVIGKWRKTKRGQEYLLEDSRKNLAHAPISGLYANWDRGELSQNQIKEIESIG